MLRVGAAVVVSPDKRAEPDRTCTFLATISVGGQSGWVELAPDRVDLAIYLVGWTLGWLLLWRLRPLPTRATASAVGEDRERNGVAVIIPARNEADALPHLLSIVVPQIDLGRRGDRRRRPFRRRQRRSSQLDTVRAWSHRHPSPWAGSASRTPAPSVLRHRPHRSCCSSTPTCGPPPIWSTASHTRSRGSPMR